MFIFFWTQRGNTPHSSLCTNYFALFAENKQTFKQKKTKGNKALNNDQWKQSKKGKLTYLRKALPQKANYYFHPLNNFISHSITGLIYCIKQSTSLWYTVQKYLYPMKTSRRDLLKLTLALLWAIYDILSVSVTQNLENLKKIHNGLTKISANGAG